jgi:hypothetical protein
MKRKAFLASIATETDGRPMGSKVKVGQQHQSLDKPKLMLDARPKRSLLLEVCLHKLVGCAKDRKHQRAESS